MSRNSTGTYTLPSGNPVVSGTLIEANWANTTLSDLATAMTDSLSRSGQGGMTAAFRAYDGTSTVPGIAWGSETTTGFYRAGAGDTRLVITGSEVMKYLATGVAVTGTLSASGNGSFGGTLAVTGAATFSGQTVTLENSTAYYPQLVNRNKTADANGSYLVLEKIRNTSVVQNGDVLGNLVFRGYDGAAYLQGAYINAVISATPGTNDMPTDLVFGTTPDGGAGPSERMRLNQAGNLGLGVTPSAWTAYKAFQLMGNNGVYGFNPGDEFGYYQNAYYNSGWKYGASGIAASRYSAYQGTHSWFTAPPGTAGNAITFTQAMTLDASGNLAIQDAKQYFWGTGRTAIQGSSSTDVMQFFTASVERARIDSSGNLLVGQTSTGYQNSKSSYISTGAYIISHSTSNVSGDTYVGFGYNGGQIGSITQSGTTAVAYNTTSDHRLKTNVTPLTGALDKVQALKPSAFDWIDGRADDGFIAHELQTVLPNVVTGEKDAVDEDGKPVYQQVDYARIVPTLVAAIQELTARLAVLEAK